GHHGVDQIATRCQERLTAEGPGEVVVQSMFIKDCLSTLAQDGIGHFGGEAEVKYHLNTAGNHIGRAGTAIDVRYLKAGRGEEFVSVIPVLSRQLGKSRSQFMDRIVSKMRVGHVPLNTLHRQYAPQRAAPAILDDVTDLAGRGGFADDAPGDLGVSGFEPLN